MSSTTPGGARRWGRWDDQAGRDGRVVARTARQALHGRADSGMVVIELTWLRVLFAQRASYRSTDTYSGRRQAADMTGRFRGRTARLLVLLTLPAILAVSGCSAFDDTAQAAPETSNRPSLNTMEASAVGDRMTLTAVVTGVSSSQSFTVQDADLPERGVLVLGPADVRAPDLVTVTGVVDLFTYTGFHERFRLADPRVYHRFESCKVLIADEVRSWAGPRRS